MSELRVLLDNTTIYAAKAGYELWPPTVQDWSSGANALSIRALMDCIECVILYDKIMLDCESRLVADNELKGGAIEIWPEFYASGSKYTQRQASDDDSDLVVDQTFDLDLSLTAAGNALRLTKTCIVNGSFSELLKEARNLWIAELLPPFYKNGKNFSTMLTDSMQVFSKPNLGAPEHKSRVTNELKEFSDLIDTTASKDRLLANFAMFAFRGFFYNSLAIMDGISYRPFSWRSDLIEKCAPGLAIHFVDFVWQRLGALRSELAQKLNSDMGSEVFTTDFPILASFVAKQCQRRSELLPTAFRIRQLPSAVALRSWIAETETNMQAQTNLLQVKKALSSVTDFIADFRKELGIKPKLELDDSKLKMKISVPAVSVDVPMPIDFGLPAWILRFLHRRAHVVWLKDLARESLILPNFTSRYAELRP